MFLVVSWIITGALLGSFGVAAIASFLMRDAPRSDDFQTPLIMLMLTTLIGAVGGGVLGGIVRRSFTDDPRRLTQLALLPLCAAVIIVFGILRYG